jgi:hypothetical protein
MLIRNDSVTRQEIRDELAARNARQLRHLRNNRMGFLCPDRPQAILDQEFRTLIMEMSQTLSELFIKAICFEYVPGIVALANVNRNQRVDLYYTVLFQLYACDRRDVLISMLDTYEYQPSANDVIAAIYFRAGACLKVLVMKMMMNEYPSDFAFPNDWEDFIQDDNSDEPFKRLVQKLEIKSRSKLEQ